MKTTMKWIASATAMCVSGCHPSGKTGVPEGRAVAWQPTNVSTVAYSLLVDVTGCFLADAPFLPPKCTEPLPVQQYEIVQVPPAAIGPSGYILFVDCTNRLFWVMKTGGVPTVGELYGPGHIERH